MRRASKLPIDGYTIDHNVKDIPKLYTCSYCGEDTQNYSRCTLTRIIDTIHQCDTCFDTWKACQPFD